MEISLVSPVYKAPTILPTLVERLNIEISKITDSFEVILVDDGCPLDSWTVIENLSKKYSFVKGIKLSRNFGQHHAITAGLDHTQGEYVIVMDCDLQDQPEEIINLFNVAKSGYDIVYARRKNRTDGFWKTTSSLLFNKFFNYLSGLKQDASIANFGIYSKKVVAEVNKLREPMRGFSPMVNWVGFKNTCIDVAHGKRFEGPSSYNWSKLINLALDIAIAYSDKPLRITVKIGFFLSVFSMFFAIYNIINYFQGNIQQPGYASLIFSIWFLGGLIIFILGIMGLYLSKTFESVKGRPLYIIDNKLNF
jgi:glycosyltransferase involved in cell wall biosynthesis